MESWPTQKGRPRDHSGHWSLKLNVRVWGLHIIKIIWTLSISYSPLSSDLQGKSIHKSLKMPYFCHQDPDWCFPPPPSPPWTAPVWGWSEIRTPRPAWTTDLEKNSANSPPPSSLCLQQWLCYHFHVLFQRKSQISFWNKSWDSSIYPLSPEWRGVGCSQWFFRTTMPALLPFLFLSTASAFLLWDRGRLGWGGKIPIHEPAEPGTAWMGRE